MSMLAERRRKSKWTLNPGRQPLWNKDDSNGIKFGQGLMEKMGWKVGQGLGVKKQGIKEPLKISVKNDSKGMGFKDSDNEWIQQQQDFNQLLEKLSSSNGTDDKNNYIDPKKDQIKTSLEEKSKHSKTRVHYQKFTRGKDLTKYSEKDLECILGSKKESINDVTDNIDLKLEEETNSYTINAGSMVDYFKQKLQEKRCEESTDSVRDGGREQSISTGVEEEHGHLLKKKAKKRKKKKERESYTKTITDKENGKIKIEDVCKYESCNDATEIVNNEEHLNNIKKEYKVKNEDCSQTSDGEMNAERNLEVTENISCDTQYKPPKKKKKEKERESYTKTVTDNENGNIKIEDVCKYESCNDATEIVNNEEHLNNIKKEYKVKNKDCSQTSDGEMNVERNLVVTENIFCDTEYKPSKKKKKKKEKENEECNLECWNQLENVEGIHGEREELDEGGSDKISPPRKKVKTEERDITDPYFDYGKETKKKKKKLKEEIVLGEGEVKCEKVVDKSECKTRKHKSKHCDVSETEESPREKEEEGHEQNERKQSLNTYKKQILEKECFYRNDIRNKIFDMVRYTNLDRFQGSNLQALKGYGV